MTVTVREAIRNVLFKEMTENEDMIMMGEAMYYTGSLFSKVITPAFNRTFGKGRVMDCPVAENAIIGMSFGAALAGMTVVPEIWASDFLLCVGNEVVNDIPKWRYQHRYEAPINMVIRAPGGLFAAGGGGPEHSQCSEAWLHNSPGLTIVAPGSPADAAGLLYSSIRCGDPVLFLEHRQVYDLSGEVDLNGDYAVPIGRADIVREGSDITLLGWSMMRTRCEKAAEMLAYKGISAEVVDPRTIKPMDMETIIESVRKTGRLLVAEESPRTGSIAGEIITGVMESGITASCARLTMPDIPYHYIPEYEAEMVPSVDEICARAMEMTKGH